MFIHVVTIHDFRSINDDPELRQILKGFLPEKFEINDDKKYEKIYVPDFRDGRSGRFIHDFNTNMTGESIRIISMAGQAIPKIRKMIFC